MKEVAQGLLLFHSAQNVGWDQHGGSRAPAHHFSVIVVGLRSLRELVPPYETKKLLQWIWHLIR